MGVVRVWCVVLCFVFCVVCDVWCVLCSVLVSEPYWITICYVLDILN